MGDSDFKDYFSSQALHYLNFRPSYPETLFQFISAQSQGHLNAWDCGTGNGQAAVSLSTYFRRVIATDPSEAQILNAFHKPNVHYRVCKAEHSGLPNNSVDLITVANAIHWFNLDLFYEEADRILRPGGLLAVWCYGSPIHQNSADVNALIRFLHDEVLGAYWLAENRLVENKYKDITLPYPELTVPRFKMEKLLSKSDLLGLFHSWSAVQRFKDRTQQDPLTTFEADLEKAWGTSELQPFYWELTVRIGRKLI